jgi:PIN domain nuclease of toxin-antitoxin system
VLEVRALPTLHSDPFDRMLLAQARVEQLVLLTNDEKVLHYGDPAKSV